MSPTCFLHSHSSYIYNPLTRFLHKANNIAKLFTYQVNNQSLTPSNWHTQFIIFHWFMKWLLGSNYWLFWYVVLFTTLYKPVGYHVACSSTPGRMRTHSITHSFSFISIMIFWKLQDDFIHHTLDTAHCKMEVAKSPQERLKWSIKSLIVMMAIIIAYSEEGITAKRESQPVGLLALLFAGGMCRWLLGTPTTI